MVYLVVFLNKIIILIFIDHLQWVFAQYNSYGHYVYCYNLNLYLLIVLTQSDI